MNFSRRNFLGGAAALAGATFAGLSPRLARAATGPARNLITVMAKGGWDVTWSVDPKTGAPIYQPPGTRRLFGNLPILVDPARPAVTSFFERFAPLTSVVNGIEVRSISHASCRKRILTGNAYEGRPDFAMIAAHDLGRSLPVPYLVLGEISFAGPLAASTGRVGTRNQLTTLLDPALAYPPLPGSPEAAALFTPDAADAIALDAFRKASAQRELAVRGARGYNKARVEDFLGSLDNAQVLKDHASAFGQPRNTISFASQAELAVQAIKDGVSWAVGLDSTLGWDTHDDVTDQGMLHDALFLGLGNLVSLLETTPGQGAGATLLDETVVVVVSEMSRTPLLNGKGGKDHWGVTSALVIGGGVAGGRAVGRTTNQLDGRLVDLATGEASSSGVSIFPENFAAGVLTLVGADPEPWFPGVTPLSAIIA